MKKEKRGQSSVEASLLIGFMIFILLVFVVIIAQKNVDAERDIYEAEVEDIAELIKTEVQLAQLAEDNYQRIFSIPPKIRERDFRLVFFSASDLGAELSALEIRNEPPFQFVKTITLPKTVIKDPAALYAFCKGTNSLTKNSAGDIIAAGVSCTP